MKRKSRAYRPSERTVYAPGLPEYGYYRCPVCDKVRTNQFWCFDCSCRCRRVKPKNIYINGKELRFIDLKEREGPVKLVREIVL